MGRGGASVFSFSHHMGFAVLVLFVLLVANGVCAMAEIAMVSARPGRLEQRANAGDAGARRAFHLKGNPTDFLSTVQVGITLIGILAGAYSGSTLAEPFADYLATNPILAPYSEPIALGLVVTLLTYFSLVIGELVPKAIALRSPEQISSLVAGPFSAIARITAPAVRLLSGSTSALLWLLRIPPATETHATEEEIRALIKQATRAGELAPSEHQLIERVFHLADRRVSSVMTPRPDLEWVDVHATPTELQDAIRNGRRRRLLVCDQELDRVLGVVHAEDLLVQSLERASLDLQALLRPPVFVPETLTMLVLLERLRTAATHTAVVIDEYGDVQGVVTESDIFDSMVGSHADTVPGEQTQVVRRPDGSWLVDAAIAIEDLRDRMPFPPLPEDEKGQYATLAGFVMTRLARVPHEGDAFMWNGLRVEIVDMDERRVDKVLLRQQSDGPGALSEGSAVPTSPPDSAP